MTTNDNNSSVEFEITKDSSVVVFNTNIYDGGDVTMSLPIETSLYAVPIGGEDIDLLMTKSGVSYERYVFSDFSLHPDGVSIIYSVKALVEKDEGLQEHLNIYSIPLDGGQIVQLNKNDLNCERNIWPILSPDGKRLVYLNGGSYNDTITELYAMEMGGPSKLLMSRNKVKSELSAGYFFISPDSQKVILSHKGNSEDETGIFLVMVDGNGATKLSKTFNEKVKISSGSKRVLYRKCGAGEKSLLFNFMQGNIDSQVTINQSEQGDIRCHPGSFADISPNGKAVAYRTSKAENIHLYGMQLKAPPLPKPVNSGTVHLLLEEKAVQ